MAANDIYHFTMKWICQNHEGVTRLVVKFLTGVGTPHGWITVFEGALKDLILPIVCNDLAISAYTMQLFTPTDPRGHPLGPLLEFQPSGTINGTGGAGGNLTGQGLIKLSPNVSGKGRRGRLNIGPLAGTAQVEGKLSNTAFTDLQALATEIFNGYTPGGSAPSADYQIDTWSKKHLADLPLIAVTAEPVIATQRRRGLRQVKTKR